MKTVAICQARMGSSRLPGKVFKGIFGRPTIQWVTDAAFAAPGVDEVVVATSTLKADDVIWAWCVDNAIPCFRGSETDVLARMLGAADEAQADIIVRLTCDCPFLDPAVIGEVIQLRKIKDAAYATNTDPPSYPDGLDVEVCTLAALESAAREATRGTDRDTVTRFIVRNRHRFPAANLVCPLPGLVAERWVLDSPEDLTFILCVARILHAKGIKTPSYLQILKILDENPDLKSINAKFSRNERFYEALLQETGVNRTYSTSQTILKDAEKTIPLGAQTYSKSKLQFPEESSPLFVTHGDGGYVFDVDGNDYVDLVGGLLPNILGYRDPDVDDAIRDQLTRGISFSLATPIEAVLSNLLSMHIPSAEMVRFGKNGSDVTTAAVRLARHITGRDKVHVCGYHGWHDWSIAVDDFRNNGVPLAVQNLSARYAWGERFHDEEVAAIILEPELYDRDGLLQFRKLCDDTGSLLIFDEIITGFRCGMGGLQAIYGITPDLSTFGKAMANGMPISALVGLRKYMERMTEISYSGTFFGETLSIAAAIATIDKLVSHNVHRHLHGFGLGLRFKIEQLISKYQTQGISLYGPYELNRIKFADKELQGRFIQEMAKNGVLIIGSHNTCYAHKETEFQKIIKAWDATLDAISKGVPLEGEIKGKAVR